MEEAVETGKEEDRLCAVAVVDGADQSLVNASRRNNCGNSQEVADPDGGGGVDLPCFSDPPFPDPSDPDEENRRGTDQSRDRALELVAMRLRRIGDVMDGDFRDVTMTSPSPRRRRGHVTDRSRRLFDLFPVPPTSRKGLLAVRDLACETLTRDLADYVTDGRDVIVAAGRTIVGCILLGLVSVMVDGPPVKIGSKGSEWTHWSIS